MLRAEAMHTIEASVQVTDAGFAKIDYQVTKVYKFLTHENSIDNR